jgi:hypothetical protein
MEFVVEVELLSLVFYSDTAQKEELSGCRKMMTSEEETKRCMCAVERDRRERGN